MTIEAFDSEAVKDVRWRVIGGGWMYPEGITTAEIEWENGEEATFSSLKKDLNTWAQDWMESHGDNEWVTDPLPEMLRGEHWYRDLGD